MALIIANIYSYPDPTQGLYRSFQHSILYILKRVIKTLAREGGSKWLKVAGLKCTQKHRKGDRKSDSASADACWSLLSLADLLKAIKMAFQGMCFKMRIKPLQQATTEFTALTTVKFPSANVARLVKDYYYRPSETNFPTSDSFYMDKAGHGLTFQASEGDKKPHTVKPGGREWLEERGIKTFTYILVSGPKIGNPPSPRHGNSTRHSPCIESFGVITCFHRTFDILHAEL
ncbi:hypothetical protein B0H14DRAFT_2567309 [Mycena olivaceomarginata]|nr:hypothetical protein B0H14DRAFT_2567309 [Mycena olivaceomarginata]